MLTSSSLVARKPHDIRAKGKKCSGLIALSLLLFSLAACGKGSDGSTSTPPLQPTVTGVTASCIPTTVSAGATSQCSATVSGTGNYSTSVTWATSIGAITNAGVFTAPGVTAATVASVTATSNADTTKFGNTTITVTLPAPPTFAQIPDVTLPALGQKIVPIDLSKYIQGGLAPFSFAVSAQTASSSIDCSIISGQLVSDYGYLAGTNTVTISVTDARQMTGKTTLNVVVKPPSVAYQLFGLGYSPYVGTQNPNYGSVVSDDQMIQQIGAIAPYTTSIRTFGCTNGLEDVAKIAKRFGLKVFVGMWISTDATANNTEIQNCIAVAQTVGVDGAIVGSETLLRNDVTPTQLIAYINQFKTAVPNTPVTTADVYTTLENNPAVVAACDFVFVNYYPFWEGIDISTAMQSLNLDDILLRAKYPAKEVVVSETGWSSFGNPTGNAIRSPANAAFYFVDFESWARAGNRKSFYFEAHDEPWKTTDDGWGIWDQNMIMKPGMIDVFNGVTMSDNWDCSAIPGGTGTPAIQFTSVPPIGSSALLSGKVLHIDPEKYRVVVYIHISSWWVKPYADQPLTTIQCDGSWSANIVTGGVDANANQIAAFLIPVTYNPPILLGAGSLPADLYANAVAYVTVPRP